MAAKIHSNVAIKGDPFEPVLSFHDTPDGFVMFMDGVGVAFDSFFAAKTFFSRVSMRMEHWDREQQRGAK